MLCDGLSPEAQSGSLPVNHHAKINASDIQGAEKRLRRFAQRTQRRSSDTAASSFHVSGH